jgi:hypothetical protein
MMIDGTDIIIAIIGLVFTGVIIPVGKAIFKWLKSKTDSEFLLNMLAESEVVADNVVASLEANLVKELKAKNADGKLTQEDIIQVGEKAIEMFISDLSEKSMEVINNNADDAIAAIKNLIEKRLSVFAK